MNWNRRIRFLLRNWHRDLGYFTLAITLVYSISGVFLSHKDVFQAISTHETYLEFKVGMEIADFIQQWSEAYPSHELNKCFIKNSGIYFYYKGGKGHYNIETGETTVENYKEHKLVAFVNHLHFNQVKGWKYVADFFSIALIFLAISGLVIVKGKNGFKKRGVWFMLAGFILVLVFICL